MIDNVIEKVGFGLTLSTLIIAILGFLISFILLLFIIHHFYYKRLKRSDKITLILAINIYINLLMVLTVFIVMNIQTVLGDLYGTEFNSSSCIFLGYLLPINYCTFYTSFVNQVIIL